jgi:phosphoglycerate dehydrogenase-like enzyme
VRQRAEPDPLPAPLTPHIAGFFGNEMRRLGEAARDGLERYCAGFPFAQAVRCEEGDRTA